MSFPAFFDTNVLYGATLNDLLLWLADAGAFRPLWSSDVLEELERNLVANGFDKAAIEHRIATMEKYFPDAMIDGYDDLIDGMKCEPKDRHVLAAAVRAHAEVLVTFNLKDFPTESTERFEPGLTIGTLEHLVATYPSRSSTTTKSCTVAEFRLTEISHSRSPRVHIPPVPPGETPPTSS